MNRFGPAGTAALTAGAVTITLRALSATLAVTAGGGDSGRKSAAPALFGGG